MAAYRFQTGKYEHKRIWRAKPVRRVRACSNSAHQRAGWEALLFAAL